MPTYAYACGQCDHRFDAFQSIKAGPLRKCPQCGKVALKRLIGTGAGILFKGSGFYITDYRSENYKKAAGGESGSTPSKAADKKESKGQTTSASTAKTDAVAPKKQSA